MNTYDFFALKNSSTRSRSPPNVLKSTKTCKSISLYGFDFFDEFKSIPDKWGQPAGGGIKYGKQNKYWNNYQCSWRGVHSMKAEKKFFRKYIDKYNIKHNI